MHSLQLLQLTERGRTLLASRRKSVALASGGVIVAGGVAAYIRSRYSCKKPESIAHCNGLSDHKEQSNKIVKNEKVSNESMPPKKEGPPLKLVAAILLSHMSLRGARDLMALLIIALLRTVSGHRLAKVQGNLFHAAYLRDKQGFLRLIIENLLLGFLQSTLFSTTKYIKGSLSLQFRKILTTLLHAPYFENMAYYKVSYVDGRIRNPEQRIASDVPRFCTELSEFLQENVMAAFDAVLYTWSLCSYASPKYIVWMLAYIFGTGGLARRISPSFGMLMSKEQQLAGEYRQLHSRLRTHAESIAFYGGENREEFHIQQKFKALIQHMGVVLHHNWWFGIAQDLIFRCLGAIVAGTLMIEPFFLGKLRPGSSALGQAETLSNLKYHSSVIIALFTSLGILFGNPMKIDRLRGYAGRIHELMTISKELSVNDASSLQRKGSRNYVTEANYIEFDGVKVVTPTGNVLVEDLTLKVESGSNLLVTGPNGSGKSSLFRVLGGLWPLMSGHLVKPGVGSDLNKEIFYVPQRPYTVVGTLRDQLIYPLTADEEVEPLTHDELVDLLKYVDLEYLLDRYPLEKEINWGDELSLGEQQRLGMARLFYHKPKFAILDECTSAVTTDMEERFCARVQAMGMSCITISHRPALVAFHDVVLSLDGEGGWKVQYKREDSAVCSTESGFDSMELSETDRQSDAMAVQRAFAMTKMDSLSSNAKSQSYISELTAASPPVSHGAPLPIIPQLQSAPRPLISRIAAMFKILVPTMFDKQGAQILSVAILIGLTSLLGNTSGFLQGKTTKYVLEQDATSYIQYFGAAMVLHFASSFMSPSLRHLTSKLALEWRIRLTRHLLKHYFRKDAYYKVFNMSDTNVDADQRITQDVEKLTTDLSTLVAGMVKPSVDMIWFTWRMKELTGRRGLSILYAYMILGLGFLKNFTPDFGGLASREQQLEGTFRYTHERLRTHAESVAFFGGGAREKAMVESRLRDLLDHSNLHNKKKWLFGVLDDFISRHLPQSVASSFSLLFAMEYVGDQSLTSTQGELADGLRYVTSIVSSSFASFGEMLQLNKTYVELSGGINRVFELEELLDAAQSDGHISTSTLSPTKPTTTHSADIISFSDVDIITPGQKMLARKLKFHILPGKGLLVTGPNGSGKSCVFRVLRGLWPLVSGKLVKPCQRIGEEAGRGCGVFHVPQRSYMCLGTLRDQIIYPLSREEAEQMALDLYGKGETSIDARKLLDSHLETILENVKLLYLLEREGGWDANKNWEDILSLGEQQRLGMARLFFHKPKFGVLDECTNATSIDVEEHLYKLANDMGITLVTSSQRPALIPYHSTELRLVDGEGKWELHSIKH
ncbi:ABC transporter D family member 1 [Camellia lanceoleosa]|uniref:ABC transporter D family member 1 n=1 Tax=Camellia lanceoleosa TaxID=1840588 RepID=A0ACC0J4G3_9ERIC|nr:ABC transporter D family member 1 [Camellia lanceoleosa]